jgi:hypothetical protein
MRSTQDDSRENKQMEIFGIIPDPIGRSNRYKPDGWIIINEQKHFIECKSCDSSKNQVSTARDFGLKKINDWSENSAFIFSKFDKTSDGFEFTDHIICTWDDLELFFSKIKKKVTTGHAGRIGIEKYEPMRKLLIENNLPIEDIEELDLSVEHSTKQNDPKISWKFLEEVGTLVDKDKDLNTQLKNLIIRR